MVSSFWSPYYMQFFSPTLMRRIRKTLRRKESPAHAPSLHERNILWLGYRRWRGGNSLLWYLPMKGRNREQVVQHWSESATTRKQTTNNHWWNKAQMFVFYIVHFSPSPPSYLDERSARCTLNWRIGLQIHRFWSDLCYLLLIENSKASPLTTGSRVTTGIFSQYLRNIS